MPKIHYKNGRASYEERSVAPYVIIKGDKMVVDIYDNYKGPLSLVDENNPWWGVNETTEAPEEQTIDEIIFDEFKDNCFCDSDGFPYPYMPNGYVTLGSDGFDVQFDIYVEHWHGHVRHETTEALALPFDDVDPNVCDGDKYILLDSILDRLSHLNENAKY